MRASNTAYAHCKTTNKLIIIHETELRKRDYLSLSLFISLPSVRSISCLRFYVLVSPRELRVDFRAKRISHVRDFAATVVPRDRSSMILNCVYFNRLGSGELSDERSTVKWLINFARSRLSNRTARFVSSPPSNYRVARRINPVLDDLARTSANKSAPRFIENSRYTRLDKIDNSNRLSLP